MAYGIIGFFGFGQWPSAAGGFRNGETWLIVLRSRADRGRLSQARPNKITLATVTDYRSFNSVLPPSRNPEATVPNFPNSQQCPSRSPKERESCRPPHSLETDQQSRRSQILPLEVQTLPHRFLHYGPTCDLPSTT